MGLIKYASVSSQLTLLKMEALSDCFVSVMALSTVCSIDTAMVFKQQLCVVFIAQRHER